MRRVGRVIQAALMRPVAFPMIRGNGEQQLMQGLERRGLYHVMFEAASNARRRSSSWP